MGLTNIYSMEIYLPYAVCAPRSCTGGMSTVLETNQPLRQISLRQLKEKVSNCIFKHAICVMRFIIPHTETPTKPFSCWCFLAVL